MVTAVFCVSCGAELLASDLYCHACGEAVDLVGGLRDHPEALLPVLVALFGWGFLISAGNGSGRLTALVTCAGSSWPSWR